MCVHLTPTLLSFSSKHAKHETATSGYVSARPIFVSIASRALHVKHLKPKLGNNSKYLGTLGDVAR